MSPLKGAQKQLPTFLDFNLKKTCTTKKDKTLMFLFEKNKKKQI